MICSDVEVHQIQLGLLETDQVLSIVPASEISSRFAWLGFYFLLALAQDMELLQ